MLEIEVKFHIEDKEHILDTLFLEGFKKRDSVYETDIYYNSEVQNLRSADKALRIRAHKYIDTGEEDCNINYKGPKIDNISMTREEIELTIPDVKTGKRFLNGIGYYEVSTVEKLRTHYVREDITCCIDEVKDLGEFLEIEIISEDDTSYERHMHRIRGIVDALSLDMNNSLRTSYLSMLQKNKEEF